MAFLRAVHEKVNIIPVIGKADALMPRETQILKQKVWLRALSENKCHDRTSSVLTLFFSNLGVTFFRAGVIRLDGVG